MTPRTWLPFRNFFQHRALVPSYLVIWAGATSLCLCAEGREGWQDKAALPWGALISFFRPRCSLQIPPMEPPPHRRSLSGEGGPSALPGAPLSLTEQQLYLLPCPKHGRGDAVWSPLGLLGNSLREE